MSNSRMISPLSRKRLHSVVFLLMSIAFVPCIWNSQPSYGYCSDWSVGRGNSTSTATSDSKLPAKPEVLWEYKTDSDKSGFEGTPIIFDGKIFVGDFEGTVHAIDIATGKAVWTVKKKDGFVTAAAANHGCIVIGDFSGMIYCLDASTGREVWAREIEQQIANGANFYGDNVLLTSEGGTTKVSDTTRRG